MKIDRSRMIRCGLALLAAFLVSAQEQASARVNLGTEQAFSLQGGDGIELSVDSRTGNVYGVFRKRLNPMRVGLLLFDARIGRWRNEWIEVPDSASVNQLGGQHFNLPKLAAGGPAGEVYMVWGPASSAITNGAFIKTYFSRQETFSPTRQWTNLDTETFAAVLTTNNELHIPTGHLNGGSGRDDFWIPMHDLDRFIRDGAGGFQRTPIDDPLGTITAIPGLGGTIHLISAFREFAYSRFANSQWRLQALISDPGDREADGVACPGRRPPGGNDIAVHPITGDVYLSAMPWDNGSNLPSEGRHCCNCGVSPQDVFVRNLRTFAVDRVSTSAMRASSDFVPRITINARGDILVAWPELFGVYYNIYDVDVGRWFSAPKELPGAGVFTNPDVFSAHAELDVVAVGNDFQIVFVDQIQRFYSRRIKMGPLGTLSAVQNLTALKNQASVQLEWTWPGVPADFDRIEVYRRIAPEKREAMTQAAIRSAFPQAKASEFERIGTVGSPLVLRYSDQVDPDFHYEYRLVVKDVFGRETDAVVSTEAAVVPLFSPVFALILLAVFGHRVRQRLHSSLA